MANVLDKIVHLAQRYLTPEQVDKINEDLKELNIPEDEEWVFYQVFQQGDELQLEIAFKVGDVITDYTFSNQSLEICTIPIDKINFLQVTETESTILFYIHSTDNDQYLVYEASQSTYRKNLKAFHKKIQLLVAGVE